MAKEMLTGTQFDSNYFSGKHNLEILMITCFFGER